MVIFMFPETKCKFLCVQIHLPHLTDILTPGHRPHPSEVIQSITGDAKTSAATSGEKISTSEPNNSDPEKLGNEITHVTTKGTMPDLSQQATAERDPFLGKGSPNKQQWKLFQPNPHPFRAIFLDLWIPWKLFAFPIVELAAFIVSWSCSSFLTINLTQSQNFAAPPYNFNSQSIGFMNFAILVGALIGLATAGPLSDWVSARATRKNGGIREPEMRLPAMSKFFSEIFAINPPPQLTTIFLTSPLRPHNDARQLHRRLRL